MEREVEVTIGEKRYAATMVYTLRHMSGLDQTYFGRKFGLTQSQVSRIETCKTLPSKDLLQRICDRYSIDMDQIYGRKPINRWQVTA